jgi:hypothetical protein
MKVTQKIFLFFILINISNSAYSSHFRGGKIEWDVTPGTRTVNFTITTSWRYEASETIIFNFGDNTSIGPITGPEISNLQNEFSVIEIKFSHTYTNDGPFTAYFGGCCRISDIVNGADSNFSVSTKVCFTNNIGSPKLVVPLEIFMEANSLNQFQLNANDSNGSQITYSTNTIGGASFIPIVGNNIASINSNGLISWNTTGTNIGDKYQMKIKISNGCSEIEFDFIIKIGCLNNAHISGSQTINQGTTVNLNITFSGTSPWTYKVTNDNTTYITTNSSVTYPVTPLNTTSYKVENLTNSNCISSTGIATITVIKPNSNLLACYNFNGNADDSQNNQNGNVFGAVLTTDRFGANNKAYQFNGTSDFISIPAANFVKNEYTYTAWVNSNSSSILNQTILSIGNNGGDQTLSFSINSSIQKWYFFSYLYYASLPIPQILSTTNNSINQWHFLVATRSLNQLKLYVDGVLVGTQSSTGVIPYYASTYKATIGARSNENIQYFSGKIDDVKIYSRPLSDSEVALIYTNESVSSDCNYICDQYMISKNSGKWDDPNTWQCNRIPTIDDIVIIDQNHLVKIDNIIGKAAKVIYKGDIIILNNGKLEIK